MSLLDIGGDCGGKYSKKQFLTLVFLPFLGGVRYSNRMKPYAYELQTVIDAAKYAGGIALSYEGRPPSVTYKNGLRSSPVTEVDCRIDDYLYKTFLKAFPEDGWLSEEKEDDNSRFKKDRYWVVDPIDGTTPFLRWLEHGMDHHNPGQQARRQFSVSIALIEGGEPVVAAVYAPLRAQMITAVKGQGLYLNEQEIGTQKRPQRLEDALYFSSVSESKDGLLEFLEKDLTMQPYGSMAYKMALAAVDEHAITASVKPKNTWDVAAGDLLCREAGLIVTDLAGKPFDYKSENIVCEGVIVANPEIYPLLKAILPNAPTGGYR